MVLLAIFNSSFSELASQFSAKNGGSRSVWTIDLLHLLHDWSSLIARKAMYFTRLLDIPATHGGVLA